jgi:hypothetical protein
MGMFHEDVCTFMTISRSILFRIRNVSDESCRENQNTSFIFNNLFSENRAVFEIMWKNMLEPDRPQTTMRRMRFACCVTKSVDTHSEYETLIVFSCQPRLRERASMLRYKYIACLVHIWPRHSLWKKIDRKLLEKYWSTFTFSVYWTLHKCEDTGCWKPLRNLSLSTDKPMERCISWKYYLVSYAINNFLLWNPNIPSILRNCLCTVYLNQLNPTRSCTSKFNLYIYTLFPLY